jgi:hypothetical protein
VLDEKEPSGYVSSRDRILLIPGEHRENGTVVYRSRSATSERASSPPPSPFPERLERFLSHVRVTGMHALVLLEGDASAAVKALTQDATDYDQNPDILKYLPMVLTSEVRARDADALAEQPWPVPEAGEVVLVALSGGGDVLGTERMPARDGLLAEASMRLVGEFTTQHAPAVHDARRTFEEAKILAAETDRRVWLVSGGPRCGPCISLALWMSGQRELLERDYVVVKVGICDVGADEVLQPYEPGDGIPWFVILDADGNALITSDGPLGNIGFPSEIESLRHLRGMLDETARRLTEAEKSDLIDTLDVNQP